MGGRLAGSTTPSSGYSSAGAAVASGSAAAASKPALVVGSVPGAKTSPVTFTVSGADADAAPSVAVTVVLPPVPVSAATPPETAAIVAAALHVTSAETSCSGAAPDFA